jgi:hypothetical protein
MIAPRCRPRRGASAPPSQAALKDDDGARQRPPKVATLDAVARNRPTLWRRARRGRSGPGPSREAAGSRSSTPDWRGRVVARSTMRACYPPHGGSASRAPYATHLAREDGQQRAQSGEASRRNRRAPTSARGCAGGEGVDRIEARNVITGRVVGTGLADEQCGRCEPHRREPGSPITKGPDEHFAMVLSADLDAPPPVDVLGGIGCPRSVASGR